MIFFNQASWKIFAHIYILFIRYSNRITEKKRKVCFVKTNLFWKAEIHYIFILVKIFWYLRQIEYGKSYRDLRKLKYISISLSLKFSISKSEWYLESNIQSDRRIEWMVQNIFIMLYAILLRYFYLFYNYNYYNTYNSNTDIYN